MAKEPPKQQPNQDDNLELIEIIVNDPDAEKQIKLPGTPFPTIPMTPEPGLDDQPPSNK